MKLEVSSAGQRAIDDRLLEDHAADRAGGQRLGCDVEAAEPGAAAGRGDRRREDSDGRRLARSVRPEEAEDLASGHLEVDSPHRLDIAGIRLAKATCFDR